jgi:undecaprenyl-diphosphatase
LTPRGRLAYDVAVFRQGDSRLTDFIKVLILGVVEGLTEFLPISSTGHLIVASVLLNFDSLNGTFNIFIQLGAVVAVVVYYWTDLWAQLKAVPRDSGVQRLWLGILIAFLPAAVLGVLFKDEIKRVLFNPTVVALSLIVGGLFFLWIERRPSLKAETQTLELTQISLRQAIGIGIAQTVALIPGVSRSGASIIGGMLTGLDRQTATKFSFYLAIPTLGGATVYDLLTNLGSLTSDSFLQLILGAVMSGIVAWLSIGWLLRYVSHHNFIPFGYYRILAGIAILLLVVAQIIPNTI